MGYSDFLAQDRKYQGRPRRQDVLLPHYFHAATDGVFLICAMKGCHRDKDDPIHLPKIHIYKDGSMWVCRYRMVCYDNYSWQSACATAWRLQCT